MSVATAAAMGVAVLAAALPAFSVTPAASGAPLASSFTAISGRCSKATALQVVERLHMGDSGIPDPSQRVGQVLCGSFLGPGSQTMVATIANGTCLPNSGWAVFTFAGGGWQLAPNGYHGGFVVALAAVGSDIRETVPVYRTGDGPCNPTGGTKARIWHWNGSRLVAGAGTATAATLHMAEFSSSDHTWCFGDEPGALTCGVSSDPMHIHTARLTRMGVLTICNGSTCVQNTNIGANNPVLRYGQQNEYGGFRCRSATKGIACTVIAGPGKGKGFFINRGDVSRIGP